MASIRVRVYMAREKGRSRDIAKAMETGIKRHTNCIVETSDMLSYERPDADVAVFYGLMRPILNGYRNVGKPAIFIDLGYWGRVEGGRREGFHKFARDARHPTKYFQNRKHDSSRFKRFNVSIREWRGPNTDGYILLVGMGAKAAAADGFRPEQWECSIVEEIRKYTDRPIVYRPKPSWHGPQGIPGTRMVIGSDGDIEEKHFKKCHAVVTHHSNAGIEALLYGIPVFCWDGVASVPGKGCKDISQIENPPIATEREQWVWDIAWTQWNASEMRSGAVWQYLKDEDLVP